MTTDSRTDVHPRVHGSFVIGERPQPGIDLAAALRATAAANAICDPRPLTERPSL